MARTVSIGNQDFEKMIQRNCFYVDKTSFIKEWWENEDEHTLITRPRRFGKTLNMSMLKCFFSNKYADRGELFEGLEIWEDEKYREIQGTYPELSGGRQAYPADPIWDHAAESAFDELPYADHRLFFCFLGCLLSGKTGGILSL